MCLYRVACIVYFSFLFNQKTAYEMRISDWSSDVCSSDLPKVYYTCPGGTVLEGSMCTMVTATPGTVSYSFPNGGTLNGTTCQTSSSSPASVTYSCPSGGTLSGNVCNTSSTLPATVTHT